VPILGVLPDRRLSELRKELALLQKTVGRAFLDPEDREMAEVSDSQGVGGSDAQSAIPER
jgi:hypothetical protein